MPKIKFLQYPVLQRLPHETTSPRKSTLASWITSFWGEDQLTGLQDLCSLTTKWYFLMYFYAPSLFLFMYLLMQINIKLKLADFQIV